MTGQEQQPESAFNQRADAAAAVLKGDLSRRLGINLPETKVAVGPDGNPPPPLPPEGSYARQAIEDQRREEALAALSRAAPVPQQPPVYQPPAEQFPSDQINGQHHSEDVSIRAQSRISDLVNLLREKDQALQQANVARSETEQQFRSQLSDLQGQYELLVRGQLDQMDPDTRSEVLQNAAIKQAVFESQRSIMQAIAPKLERFEERERQRELYELSERYPGFNQMHIPLINAFRERNPACTLEHAFKAVATIDELAQRGSAPAPAVPPSVPPGRGATSRIEQQYQQEQRSDPEVEMRQEAQQAYALLRSADPMQRKIGMQMVHNNIGNRLGVQLPGS